MRIRLSKSVVFDMSSKDIIADGFRVWLAGESGSGKSSAAMLIASQHIQQGGQTVVLDAHGEYEELWGVSPGSVTKIGYGTAPVGEESVEYCIEQVRVGNSLLIDLSHWTDLEPDKLDKFVFEFVRELYKFRREKPQQMLVVVEEAHSMIPQMQESGQTRNVKVFLSVITGGRKYGLNFVLCSQQQSLVDIRAIRGCNVRIFLRISDEGDWKKIKSYVPSGLGIGFKNGDKRHDITHFGSGEALLISRWTGDRRVQLEYPKVTPRQPLIDAMAERAENESAESELLS